MAYQGIDNWRAIYAPMLRMRSGHADPIGFDEDWDDGDLDAWGEVTTEEREKVTVEKPAQPAQTGFESPSFQFTFPKESDPGRASADQNAAMKGVDPGKVAGVGGLFDLARTFIGTPYVFGASGPDAFDCSGFVKYLFERKMGVSLPHSAAAQVSATKPISREELQPGDLIFYRYGRLGHVVDHVEVYMGKGKQIGTSNPTDDLDIDNVDWDNVAGFGRVGGGVAADPMGPKPKSRVIQEPVPRDRTQVPGALAGGNQSSFVNTLAEIMTDDTVAVRKTRTPAFKGPEAGIKAQLYRGFLDAGRQDLARMVSTKDFKTWIAAESGWRTDATSPANNHGKANDGLFQVWRGHSYNANGQVARMSAYEQAQLIAQNFSHLTPDAIRSYAAAIRSGTYHGWG